VTPAVNGRSLEPKLRSNYRDGRAAVIDERAPSCDKFHKRHGGSAKLPVRLGSRMDGGRHRAIIMEDTSNVYQSPHASSVLSGAAVQQHRGTVDTQH
jgi:hypothetical protein